MPEAKKNQKDPKLQNKGAANGSKGVTRAYVLLAIPVFLLLSWYAYTVVFEFNKPEMTKFESELAAKIKTLTSRSVKEGFETKNVTICQNMIDQYTTPAGFSRTSEALHTLVGLPATATKEVLGERCIEFAKAVTEMQKISHHVRHVILCKDSIFEADSSYQYYIKADPGGRGALENVSTGKEQLLEIPRGDSTVLNMWQLYNFDDQCIIVGLSMTGVFRLSGKAKYNKKPAP